jgi:hypothetical protein
MLHRRWPILVLVGSLVASAACGTSSPAAHPGAAVPRVVTTAPVVTTPTSTVPPSTVPPTTTTVDPGALPQTKDLPRADDATFLARMSVLWHGIVSGEPAPALPAFFPLSAYQQVKALPNPAADWHTRLVALYDADLRRLHASLGAEAASAEFLGIDVPATATWMAIGSEYNKESYWRVLGSRVRYRVGGVSRSFIVQSLISWRGQWYVVHLTTPPS